MCKHEAEGHWLIQMSGGQQILIWPPLLKKNPWFTAQILIHTMTFQVSHTFFFSCKHRSHTIRLYCSNIQPFLGHFNALTCYFSNGYNRVCSPEKEKCCQLYSNCLPSTIWEQRLSWVERISATGYDYLQNSSLRARWSSRVLSLRSVPCGGLDLGTHPTHRIHRHQGSMKMV